MSRKKFFLEQAILVIFIAIVNFLAKKFYWYSGIWYFDMPMHFLGGLWLGLIFLWWFWPQNISFISVLKVMLGVLFIGIFWELFELMFVNYVAQESFDLLDTLSDICFDLAGGFLAILYYSQKVTPSLEKLL